MGINENDDDRFDRGDDDDMGEGGAGGADFEELQRILRDMLNGSGAAPQNENFEQFAKAAGIPVDPHALQGLFSTLQNAMHGSAAGDGGIDWSVARRTAIEVAGKVEGGDLDPESVLRAFPVAALWLDEATDLGPTPDSARTLGRIEWVQQTIDTWVSLAEPVAESITNALMSALNDQMPEELGGALQGATPMLRSVGGALFAVQLGTIIGKLSGEVVSAGDVGIPLLSGPGREGGALIPAGVAKFSAGLDQNAETVTLYLALRELAHARLFRHTKWLRLHLLTAITDYARGIHIDTDRMEDIARDIDPSHPEEIQAIIADGSLIPPKSPAQEAAHQRLETMLALIEGWVDVVTADAAKRIPGADGIAEMVRRRRATGGPAEHAFSALVGLELRPRRLREAADMWRLVAERSDVATRDGLWAHPDLLPSSEEIDHPARLLERLGIAGVDGTDTVPDEFDIALAELLDSASNDSATKDSASNDSSETPGADDDGADNPGADNPGADDADNPGADDTGTPGTDDTPQ